MIDRYTKVVLTIIAVALVWLAAHQTISSAVATVHEPMAVFLAQVSNGAAKCLAGHSGMIGGDTGPCVAMW